MIGALIGDLAAWTYEHDKDTFFKQLIPNEGIDCEPSIYGHTILKAACRNVLACPWISTEPILIGRIVDLRYYAQWLMWQIVYAWHEEDEQINGLPTFNGVDRGEKICGSFVINLIRSLRKGATKSEAYHSIYSFEQYSKNHYWKANTPENKIDMMAYIFRAWNAFYLGFDYTSTIHNAMKWSGNRHLTAILAGAFAEAMYGCEYTMIKSKYSPSGNEYNSFNLYSYSEKLGYPEGLINKIFAFTNKRRAFFAKNNALTNVERHHWKDCKLRLYKDFSEDEKIKILKAGYTGWENRFGLYLDDGWIYCYRSHCLLLRFKLIKSETSDTYRIENVQLSGEKEYNLCIGGLECALVQTCDITLDKEFQNFIRGIEYSLFYHGETKAPESLSEEEKGYWWMEQQYYYHRYPEDKQRKMWERDAMTICLEDEGLVKYMKSDKIPLAVKGMLAFTVQDFLYHAPMGGAKEVYEFAIYIGNHYKV